MMQILVALFSSSFIHLLIESKIMAFIAIGDFPSGSWIDASISVLRSIMNGNEKEKRGRTEQLGF